MKHLPLLAILLLPVFAFAERDQWTGFRPEEVGITNSEFEQVKSSGMSKARLLELLEYGIMPSEYFSNPWDKLGISENQWVDSKKKGLENGDVDRTLKRGSEFNSEPLIAFVLPGYYAYKSDRLYTGLTMSGIAVGSLAGIFFHQKEVRDRATDVEEEKAVRPFYVATLIGSMIWSGADAWYHTRYRFNPDAGRFSLVPTNDGAIAAWQFSF